MHSIDAFAVPTSSTWEAYRRRQGVALGLCLLAFVVGIAAGVAGAFPLSDVGLLMLLSQVIVFVSAWARLDRVPLGTAREFETDMDEVPGDWGVRLKRLRLHLPVLWVACLVLVLHERAGAASWWASLLIAIAPLVCAANAVYGPSGGSLAFSPLMNKELVDRARSGSTREG